MVHSCSYPSCKNTNRKTVGVAYHRFPLDPDYESIWKNICNIADDNLKNKRVCSDHFILTDYVDYEHKSLAKDAVPQGTINEVANLKAKVLSLTKRNKYLKNQLTACKQSKKNLQQSKRRLENFKWYKSAMLRIKQTRWLAEEKKLKSQIRKMNVEIEKSKNFRKKVEGILTSTQIRVLENSQERANWTGKDIARCLALKCLSEKAYKFMREEWNFPLPCVRTLRNTLKTFQISTGPINGVFRMLNSLFEDKSSMEKQVVLCFDEMAISNKVCYLENEDRIIGPHQQLLLLCIRGLFTSFKIPIYLNFDFKLEKEVIDDLIERLHQSGLFLRAVVNDLGGGNRGLMNKMEVSMDKPYYWHAKSSTFIWWFPDMAHLLKLLRNHFIDSGLKLVISEDFNIIIKKSIIKELLDMDNAELKSLFKLTENHINVEKKDRMNVRKACELFSSSTANGIRKYSTFPQKEEIADFFQLCNDFWDVTTARIKNHPTYDLKSAYGHLHLKERQDFVINSFEQTILTLRIGKRGRSLKPFQIGMIVFIRALRGLWNEISCEEMAPEYLITSNLGQCYLENIFSQVRGLGGFNINPNPKECIHRIKCLMLSMLFKTLKSSNTLLQDDATTYAAELIEFLKTDGSTPATSSISYEGEDVEQEVIISEDNWQQFYSSLNNNERCEYGGQEYLAGYFAKKFSSKYSGMRMEGETVRMPHSWIDTISRGGLVVPTYNWINVFRELNKEFCVYHSSSGAFDTYRSGFGVNQTLVAHLKTKFRCLHEDIIKFFVKTRTYIRVKHINTVYAQKPRPTNHSLRSAN